MPNEGLTAVNPHCLERVMDLSESQAVCTSEDIYDANGMKLLAKGATISRAMQEKLIRHKLHKPLETSLTVADGVTSEFVLQTARQLLEEMTPLQVCLDAGQAKISPLDVISRIRLNGSMSLLLTLAHNSEDGKSYRHSVLVCLIATVFAIKAKLTQDELLTVALAGLLHDVGEMYLSPAYLKSSAHLRPEEWKHVVVHPKVGQIAIQELTPYPPAVARAVAEHHERYDGSGYPRQLSGKQLSREGAIVAAAETLGGIFMQPDNTLQRACLAMKLIPGEFAPEVVSVVSATTQAVAPLIVRENIKPLADQEARLKALHSKLMEALGICVEISASPLARSKAVQDAQRRALDRLSVVKRSMASSGISECVPAPQLVVDEANDSELLLELEVVAKELEWRLRDIARDLSLRLSGQDAAAQGLFSNLIKALDSQQD